MKAPAVRLWRNPGFRWLWAGESVSMLGSQVTLLGLPTAAILLLHGGPLQVGLLDALQFAALPTVGLVAGVWADRLHRRPIMIAADLGQAAALGSIPMAYLVHELTLIHIYVVALITGVFAVFAGVARQSFLPTLVGNAELVDGNSKLEFSTGLAELAGPALAGAAIQAVGAARAMAIDAMSFLFSVFALTRIRVSEPDPKPLPANAHPNFLDELREGLRVVLGNDILRRMAACTATANFGYSIGLAVLLVFFYRSLHLSPSLVGLVFSLGSFGLILGTLATPALTRRLGLGKSLALSIVLEPLSVLGAPVALVAPPLLVLGFAQFLGNAGHPLYSINQVSLRQAITPNRLRARMTATMRAISGASLPLGSVTGGILGNQLGVAPTLVLGGLISLLASLWILLGPVVALRAQPLAVHS